MKVTTTVALVACIAAGVSALPKPDDSQTDRPIYPGWKRDDDSQTDRPIYPGWKRSD